MTEETVRNAIAPLKRKCALVQAEYRHAWDYGTKEEEDRAYERVIQCRARYDAGRSLEQRL